MSYSCIQMYRHARTTCKTKVNIRSCSGHAASSCSIPGQSFENVVEIQRYLLNRNRVDLFLIFEALLYCEISPTKISRHFRWRRRLIHVDQNYKPVNNFKSFNLINIDFFKRKEKQALLSFKISEKSSQKDVEDGQNQFL